MKTKEVINFLQYASSLPFNDTQLTGQYFEIFYYNTVTYQVVDNMVVSRIKHSNPILPTV